MLSIVKWREIVSEDGSYLVGKFIGCGSGILSLNKISLVANYKNDVNAPHSQPVIINAMTVWLRPIIPLGIIKIIKEHVLIAEYHHNMDNEREAAAIAKENKTASNTPEGTIRSSIVRLMNGDTTLKTLSITTQCYCDMEIMSNYNNHIRREDGGDLQENAVNEFLTAQTCLAI
jgi:hypothetical protein